MVKGEKENYGLKLPIRYEKNDLLDKMVVYVMRSRVPLWSCEQPVDINTWHIPIAVYTEQYLLMTSRKPAGNM
jgi:hypothetical protein